MDGCRRGKRAKAQTSAGREFETRYPTQGLLWGYKVQLCVSVVHPGKRPKVGDRQSGRSTGGSLISQGRYGNCEGQTGTLKTSGKRSSGEAGKANPLRGGFTGLLKPKLRKTLPGLYH